MVNRVLDALRHQPDVKIRVLVVDSNQDAATSLAMVLSLEGCEADTAFSGNDALEKARAACPHVISSAIMLPDLSGFELAARLRNVCPETLLVALTGCGSDADRLQAKEAGFAYHFLKPDGVQEVLSLVRHLAESRHD